MRMLRAAVTLAIAAGLVAAWKAAPPLDTLWHRASAPSAAAASFYVSPTGNNHASGTSPAHPWRTLARASAARLRPGDRLLLRGRHVYGGYLLIGKSDSGTSSRRVLISSYGRGRATISSSSSGVVLFDAANVTITDLVVVGQQAMRPSTAGIQVYSDLRSGRLAHVVIDQVDVRGFGFGIAIGGTHNGAGYSDVWVKRSALHGNLDAGLTTYGPTFSPAAPSYANARVHIVGVRAFGNRGDPANVSKNSGSGIVLASVSGATITRSSAYGNGGRGGAPQEGPEGIWAYDASHVVIEHDVAHDNSSKSGQDGGGFGFDQSTFQSVMEYNLSYRNHGPGYLLFGGRRSPQRGDVIRFNISYHDGLGSAVLGGIAMGGRTTNAAVYQNTVVMATAGAQTTLKLYGKPLRDRVFNNAFVGSSRGPLLYAIHPVTTSEVRLAGNDYVVPTGTWLVKWGSSAVYYSRATWRAATAEEIVRGQPTGLDVLPHFVNPAPARSGGAGFALKRTSALRGAGLDLARLFGVHPGKVNYGGRPYRTDRPNVGAQ
jgi:hypothetical protein